MGIKDYFDSMDDVKTEIFALPGVQDETPSWGTGISGFINRAGFSIRLILLEKELITFALLQWLCIAAGYYLWVQMIGWIPAEAWQHASGSRSATPGDIILFMWSFVCVGLTAFPLGLLTGCMGAVHVQNRLGRESTIAGCLRMVLPRAWPLWVFHWIDGWWTVMRILDRLPKKNDRRSALEKVFSETIYYAWKLGTIGILPGLVTGRGLADAGKRSVQMVAAKLKDVVLLRAGYSALCWVVGVGTYIGSFYYFAKCPGLFAARLGAETAIYKFYFWMALPIIAAAGAVMLFLRPIYVISACDIYADFVKERGENLLLPPPPKQASGGSAMAVAVILALGILGIMLFRNELGLSGYLTFLP